MVDLQNEADCDFCKNKREVLDRDIAGYHEKAPCPKCRDGSWAYLAMRVWFNKYHALAGTETRDIGVLTERKKLEVADQAESNKVLSQEWAVDLVRQLAVDSEMLTSEEDGLTPENFISQLSPHSVKKFRLDILGCLLELLATNFDNKGKQIPVVVEGTEEELLETVAFSYLRRFWSDQTSETMIKGLFEHGFDEGLNKISMASFFGSVLLIQNKFQLGETEDPSN